MDSDIKVPPLPTESTELSKCSLVNLGFARIKPRILCTGFVDMTDTRFVDIADTVCVDLTDYSVISGHSR